MDNNTPLHHSPLPEKKIASRPETVDFYTALKEVVKGHKITKLEWNDFRIYGFLGIDGHLKINLTDKLSDWVLQEADIQGEDWKVLDETN